MRSPYVSNWSPHEIVEDAVPDDERLWIPVADNVWVRPLYFDTLHGAWANVMRTRTAGVISRHLHPAPVHGYVIKGRWHYLEHDWVAEAGKYVFEPPGEVHTLISDDEEEVLTIFWVSACLVYVDEDGNATGRIDDVFTRIADAERHYESVGLGSDYVKRFVR